MKHELEKKELIESYHKGYKEGRNIAFKHLLGFIEKETFKEQFERNPKSCLVLLTEILKS